MVKTSMSHEDYLEAIVMLGGTTDAPVRSVDVANKLGVSKASVNKAGYAYGRSVLDRHRMLFDFLTKALGIEPEVAEVEACQMEHAISDASFEKWGAFVRSLDL